MEVIQAIQLFNENNYYRQYLQQQALLQQINLLHQSQPLFLPVRSYDYTGDISQQSNTSFRSRLSSNNDNVKRDIPDIAKWQEPSPMESIAYPLGKKNKEFKCLNQMSKTMMITYLKRQ